MKEMAADDIEHSILKGETIAEATFVSNNREEEV